MGQASIDASAILARATPEGEAEYQALVSQLRAKWPDLQPIASQPSVSNSDRDPSIVFFRRIDEDRETQTHTTLLALRLGIPIAFFRAYRVYETERGTPVCIGRLPLPEWAHLWNVVLIAAIAACVAIVVYGGLGG
jgi:hypothetical protein